MNLQQFHDYISSFKDGTVFEYGISDPFSWRGSYGEVAFTIVEEEMLKEDILAKISMAFKNYFDGYSGGFYEYNQYTPVIFERNCSEYTDGGYTANVISKIEGSEASISQEHRLVKLAFSNDSGGCT